MPTGWPKPSIPRLEREKEICYIFHHIHNAGPVRDLELYTFKILFLAVEVTDVDVTSPLKKST